MRKNSNDYKRQTSYIAGIDGLRAIAVLTVFAYHLKLPFAKGGLLGVTIFFVISGFLITRILVSELENTKTIQLKSFWIRRVKRLLPAVLTMVTALILVSAVFDRILFTKACSDLLSVIFGYNNWWQIFNDVSYFENAGAPSPLTHCWSLAIEAQFYLLYPLLLIVLAKLKDWKKISACVTILSAIVSMGAMWVLFDLFKNDPSRAYYGTDTRVFSLLFGAFLAFIAESGKIEKNIPRILRDAIGTAAFIGLLYMIVRIDGNSSFMYKGGQGIASACTALMIFSLLDAEGILSRILSVFPLKWIGERSYGIYLWHYPVILLLGNGGKSLWWVTVTGILLTCVLSALSYRFIETPIRCGAIENSIEIIKKQPKTRLGNENLAVWSAAFLMMAGALFCVAFVPRKSALGNINMEALEKQAEKSNAMIQSKILQLEELKKQKEESDSEKKLELEDTQGTEEKLTSDEKQDTKEKPLSDEEILNNLNLLLIGDSITLGATEEFYRFFPGSISDAAVSRQATESIGIYDSYANGYGWNGEGVIFALGSNGLLYDSLSTIRAMIGEDRPLFVVTIRAPYVSWEGSNNQEIYEFAQSTKNTYLIDWHKISEGHGEYFVEDGTHLTSEGITAYVNGIKEAVLEVYRQE